MIKARNLLTTAGVALLGLTVAAPALATDPLPNIFTTNHGIDCKASYGQYAQEGFGEPGAGNFSSTSSLRLFCPASHDETYDNSFGPWVVIGASLRYSDSSATQPFSCYIFAVEETGGTYWGANQYTCSTGGCVDSTSSYTGAGTLNWNNPFPNAIGQGTQVGFSCAVPPSSTYASWVEGYQTYLQRSGW